MAIILEMLEYLFYDHLSSHPTAETVYDQSSLW